HDMPSLLKAFEAAQQHDRPVCFIAYTIKGFGLPLAGHKDNHAGLMTTAQTETLREELKVRSGHEWEPFEGLATPMAQLEDFIAAAPFNRKGRRRFAAARIDVPEEITTAQPAVTSTQAGFGLLMNEIGKTGSDLA